MTEASPLRIPYGTLVVLVGAPGAGKSTWANRWFLADQVVSSDALRAMVGTSEHDQRASIDAFDLLDVLVERRLARGLTTVVDSTGLDDDRRRAWLAAASRHRRPTHAVLFETDAKQCRARNKRRSRPVPARVLTGQLQRVADIGPELARQFDQVTAPGPARTLPPNFASAEAAADRQEDAPVWLRFALQIPSFTWPGEDDAIGPRLSEIAGEAEEAGFSSLWVMDHFLQIPFVGREWEPMLESYTTLGFLAAATRRMRLGTMVTGVTYRNIGHLAKIVATLDVLSGGRAMCGLGAAWFEREHTAYGWSFPSLAERYELLEDALQALPLMWGPGSPAFDGTRISIPAATCYPRPLQESIPIVVGGSGERRTFRLVAQYADACNLFGESDVVVRKLEVLADHCADVGRAPEEVTVTHLSTVLAAADDERLSARVDELRGDATTREQYAGRMNAATVDDHVGRFRRLAEAGVQEAVVSLADVGLAGSIEGFVPVIDAFR